MSSGLQSWTATGVATVASIYALDTVSVAAGGLFVATGLLAGASHPTALALLALSYLAWGLALGPSLGANWELLRRTGASTCLPSKAAHDIALRRGASEGTCRLATAAGYVGAELAKETPYYLGAAGAVLLVEDVTAVGAIAFLAGANLGAATYELGLASATRGLLRRRRRPAFASFEAEWDPHRYLADYYGKLEDDERHTIAFLVGSARGLPPGQRVLVFGAGPTLHHAFPFADCARTIDLSDVLACNLREIERWIGDGPDAHDWSPFVRHALACAGAATDDAAVAAREAALRRRIGRLVLADLRRCEPIGAGAPTWDVVVTAYCADSATPERETWALYMQRIAKLVRPGGLLVVAALRRCRGYRVGGQTFPSANIDESDVRRVLDPMTDDLHVEARLLPGQAHHGYDGILLASGRRRAAAVARAGSG
ncbi:MAG: guanitoxin biosynthesis pre-guanitoxin forming N-methyltransferase GntF [Amaricoccus sp.]